MREVFKQRAVLLDQRDEVFLAIGLIAREQDHMMRTFNRLNAVDLYEAKLIDER